MNQTSKNNFRFRLLNKTLVVIDWANVYGWFKDLGWIIDVQKLFNHLSSYPEVIDKRFYFGVESGNLKSENFKTRIQAIGFNLVSKEVKFVPVSLDKSHFKLLIKELFDVLDGMKTTNSKIATQLYELRKKIENRLSDLEPDFDNDGTAAGTSPAYAPEDEKVYTETYALIEQLDEELKKLNINIDELQKQLSSPVMRRKCDFDVEMARDVFNLSQTFETLVIFSGDGDYAALAEDLVARGKKVILVFAPGHKGKEYDVIKKGIFLCSVQQLKDELSL